MTRSELIAALAEKYNKLTAADIEALVKLLLDAMTKALGKHPVKSSMTGR